MQREGRAAQGGVVRAPPLTTAGVAPRFCDPGSACFWYLCLRTRRPGRVQRTLLGTQGQADTRWAADLFDLSLWESGMGELSFQTACVGEQKVILDFGCELPQEITKSRPVRVGCAYGREDTGAGLGSPALKVRPTHGSPFLHLSPASCFGTIPKQALQERVERKSEHRRFLQSGHGTPSCLGGLGCAGGGRGTGPRQPPWIIPEA